MNEEQELIIESVRNKMFIIDQEMSDKKRYKKFIEEIFEYLKAGFEIKELRECPVYFRFHENSEIRTLQLRHFLTNLIFWEPLIALDSVSYLDDSFLVNPTMISSRYIKSYIDTKIIVPYRKKIPNKTLNKIIHDLIFNLSRISTDFNPILGMSVSMESFMNVANANPRFNEIIRTKIDEGMQPSDIEDYLHGLTKEMVQILSNEDNSLKPMLRSGTGIKDKQLQEFAISGGLKPGLDGNTMPVPINSNLVVGGLGSVSGYYIDSLGGRKSLIFNKNVNNIAAYYSNIVCDLF